MNFTMTVTGVHQSCLDRQVTERVNIENFEGAILMNRRGGQQPARRSLEGVGGVLGLWVNFCDFAFTRSLFSIACEPGDGRGLSSVPAFGRDEWEETIWRK